MSINSGSNQDGLAYAGGRHYSFDTERKTSREYILMFHMAKVYSSHVFWMVTDRQNSDEKTKGTGYAVYFVVMEVLTWKKIYSLATLNISSFLVYHKFSN